MAAHLLRAGHDVRLLLTDKWFEHGQVPRGYPFPRERMTVLPLLNDRYDLPLLRFPAIEKVVRDADVLHLLGHLSPLAAAVCAAARRQRKPWVVCTAGVLPFRGRSLRLKRLVQSLWGRRALREASRLIAITPDEQALLQPFASSPDRVVVVPNAIDDPCPAHPAPFESSPYILFLGGFHPTKGADLLVEAFARVARTELSGHLLVMAGAYDFNRQAIELLAERLGIHDRIRFAGWLAGDSKEAALAGASFVVIPSRLDAMTIVVLEAGRAGRPVLLTAGCGFPDVAVQGGGHLVEASADALAEGLRAMADARERWPEMGENMRRIAQRYSWPAITERYAQLFREVLDETGDRLRRGGRNHRGTESTENGS